jgi:4-amino-4-deoxy-L-arabinose transferase-like glycosyltransferase
MENVQWLERTRPPGVLADAANRSTSAAWSSRKEVLILLAVAVLVRLPVVWAATDVRTPIQDEQHYVALAGSLVNGDGFAWGPGRPTSIRPPLYPFFVATIWSISGSQSLQIVRWAQLGLSALSVVLLYAIGRRWFNRRVAFLAAIGLALYPSLIFSGALLLTETLFSTLLLCTTLLFVRFTEQPSKAGAFFTGFALGLAALARSVLWPFVGVLALLVWAAASRQRRTNRLAMVGVLILGYATAVGPWSARNSALQRTFTVVDTMGGLNLLMGNYEHTPEDRMWEAVILTDTSLSWSASLPSRAPDGSLWTEGTKEKWAQRQAVSFMMSHPLTTLRRAVLKFADFWGLERDFLAGVQRGYYAPPAFLVAAAGAAITVSYVCAMFLAILGILLAPPRGNAHAFLLTVILFVAGVHTVVFGHSRYHLPLIPLLLLYAAAAVDTRAWRAIFEKTPAALVSVSLMAGLLVIWAREILVRDWDKIQRLIGWGT